MNFTEDCNKIFRKLSLDENHYLNKKNTYEYYNSFWKNINLLSKGGYFKICTIDSFCNKLKIGMNFTMNSYMQGISELMFSIYANAKGYSYEVDKCLKTTDNYDVDIQIKHNNYTFNIEVKTPNLMVKSDKRKLNVNTCFRTMNKNKNEKAKKIVEEDILRIISENSEGKYEGWSYKKLDDNKILEYLKSAQDKFIESDKNSINILVIAVESEEMQNYWWYLYNRMSGIFTNSFEGKFRDKNNKVITSTDFNKTDVIYLTNIPSGHLKLSDEFDAWNLSSYCNLLCINYNSNKFINDKNSIMYSLICDLLPNVSKKFENGYKEFQKESEKKGIPLEFLYFPAFLTENFKKIY
ncbi:hypothetical protein ACNULB_01495 [Clostridium perfringens]|uniref:hypothetical protein n=1 Tax=Clostridium perfringens TaxID=1502 RepID=UPI003AFFC62D